jgi:4'-phosphopantetheinyl transferase
MLNASQDRIDLWLVQWHELVDSNLLQEYREVLSDQEREREASFRFEKDRVRYRVTRALVRTVLSKYAALRPEQWSFRENTYGRPAIANEMPEAQSISFNVAHSGTMIVLAIMKTREIGVDIECIEEKHELMDLADRYFSKTEVVSLRALPEREQTLRFFAYWTLKESYIKARGLGLSLPLDQFSFDLQTPGVISFHSETDHHSTRWRFWQAEYFGDYLVSVCADSIGKEAPELAVRRIIPFQSEELLPSNVIRHSPQ